MLFLFDDRREWRSELRFTNKIAYQGNRRDALFG